MWGAAPLIAAAVAVSACSGDGLGSVKLSKTLDLFTITKPESAALPAEDATLGRSGPVAPEEFVDAAGQCVSGAPPPTASIDQTAPGAGEAVPAVTDTPVPILGGVALGMTECDVARRAGQPTNVVISADDTGARLTVLTYLTGTWPGIYRFSTGRLKEIERAPLPPAPPKPVRSKKPAKPKAKPVAR